MMEEIVADDFDMWMDSIEFVNKEGELIPAVLMADESDDPENDRE